MSNINVMPLPKAFSNAIDNFLVLLEKKKNIYIYINMAKANIRNFFSPPAHW